MRRQDSNLRPPGYELRWVSPSAASQCFPDLFEPEMAQNPKVVPLRSTVTFSNLGQGLGQQKNRASPKKAVHFSITSPLRASMMRRIFRSTRSGIWELLLHSRHFPAFVIHTFVALADGALRHMDVDRLQGIALVGPEVHPIWADLKNLRHFQSLPAGQIPESNGPWIQSLPDTGRSLRR